MNHFKEYLKSIKNTININIVFLAVFTLYSLECFSFDQFRDILHYTTEDAYYYFKIAYNVSINGHFTFDTINNTNGFQPLWLFCIIPLFLLKFNFETTIRLILCCQAILMSLSAILLIKTLKRRFTQAVTLGVLIVFVFNIYFQSLTGMETPITLLVIFLFLNYFISNDGFHNLSNQNIFFIGLLFSFLTLARLDTFAFFLSFILSFFIYNYINISKVKTIFLKIIFLSLSFSILLIPYISWNIMAFGELIPISAQLKSSFPKLTLNSPFILLTEFNKINLVLSIFCALVYIVWFATRLNRMSKSDHRGALDWSIFILSLGSILHFTFYLLFARWGIFNWHYMIYRIHIVFISALILNYLYQHFNKFFTCSLLVILFVTGMFWLINRNYFPNFETTFEYQAYKTAMWAKINTPKETRFAMSDCGIFGFFSERATINLDGLANNIDFQDVLKKKKLNSYLEKNKVQFIVHHSKHNLYKSYQSNNFIYKKYYPSHLWGTLSDPIFLKSKNEVYRSQLYLDNYYYTSFSIWKFER